jgi:hypothetical protein
MAIVLLVVLGVGFGISLGAVGYPLLLLTLARRESERAALEADRTTWVRTTVSPRRLAEAAPPSTHPSVTAGP